MLLRRFNAFDHRTRSRSRWIPRTRGYRSPSLKPIPTRCWLCIARFCACAPRAAISSRCWRCHSISARRRCCATCASCRRLRPAPSRPSPGRGLATLPDPDPGGPQGDWRQPDPGGEAPRDDQTDHPVPDPQARHRCAPIPLEEIGRPASRFSGQVKKASGEAATGCYIFVLFFE